MMYAWYLDDMNIVDAFISYKYDTPEPLEYYPMNIGCITLTTLQTPGVIRIDFYTSTPKKIAVDFIKGFTKYLQAYRF